MSEEMPDTCYEHTSSTYIPRRVEVRGEDWNVREEKKFRPIFERLNDGMCARGERKRKIFIFQILASYISRSNFLWPAEGWIEKSAWLKLPSNWFVMTFLLLPAQLSLGLPGKLQYNFLWVCPCYARERLFRIDELWLWEKWPERPPFRLSIPVFCTKNMIPAEYRNWKV